MFGSTKIKIEKDVWRKIKRYAEVAGYASPEEFVQHVIEKEIAVLEEAQTNEELTKKLRGLGYIS